MLVLQDGGADPPRVLMLQVTRVTPSNWQHPSQGDGTPGSTQGPPPAELPAGDSGQGAAWCELQDP